MKRLKGSELKMPELKAPAFLADLYYDLRDRRLLPLVALVAVAIVATPFLLGQSSEADLPPAAGETAALGETSGGTATLAVVEAKPGLRNYRERLRGRKPTDPFRQLGRSTSGGGSPASSSESSAVTSTTTRSSSATSGNSGSSPSPSAVPGGSTAPKQGGSGHQGASGGDAPAKDGNGGGKGGGSGGKNGSKDGSGDEPPNATLYTFGVDLTIVHSSGSKAEGNKKTDEPQKRKRVLPPTVLPSKKKQVVTYMGLSPKTRKPLFLVSPEVTGVFGEGKCAAGTERCQLIELEPGFPQIFEYGDNGDRYSIKVTDVEFVVTGHS